VIPTDQVALNLMYRIFFKTLPKVASYPAYQNLRNNFTVQFLKYKLLKLKLRVFLAGHSVAMVNYCHRIDTNMFTGDWAVF